MEIIEKEICKLYENGYNYKEIGLELNKDPRTIKKIILKHGVTPKIKLRRSKYNLNESYFDNVNEKQLWLISLLAADGWIKNGKYIGISQSGDNGYKLIKYIKRELEYDAPTYHKETDYSVAHSINITSEKFCSILSKFNIVENKSLIYELPKLKNLTEFKSFLRGYIEGDGSVGVYDNGSGYEYVVVSFVGTKNFIETCEEWLPIKYSGKRHIKRSNNLYELRWYGKNAIEFGNWVFSSKNLFISEKIRIFEEFKKTNNAKYVFYDEKKIEVKKLLTEGKKVSEIVKLTGIPFQTIYKWKKEN